MDPVLSWILAFWNLEESLQEGPGTNHLYLLLHSEEIEFFLILVYVHLLKNFFSTYSTYRIVVFCILNLTVYLILSYLSIGLKMRLMRSMIPWMTWGKLHRVHLSWGMNKIRLEWADNIYDMSKARHLRWNHRTF